MSWFDTAGIANIAKTALKEAQRTIDKALDIKEDNVIAPTNTPIDTNSDDFFGTWGMAPVPESSGKEEKTVVTASPSKNKSSLWGSFTGSFFDPYAVQQLNPNQAIKEQYSAQPRDSVDSLDDSVDLGIEHFTESKLVVQPSDESCEDILLDEKQENSNRLSIISLDSDKKSESISCLTTPESESITRLTTESIEVLTTPNSITSPSSIEVLSLETPDSIEVIPEDVDAEDTVSCNSLSESTHSTATQSTIYENLNFPQKHKALSERSEAPITRAPSRSGMHLPLQQVSNVIDIPQDSQTTTIANISEGDDSTCSDRTLVASDTLLELESSSDTSTTTDSNTSSLYLKNMIADAMSEKREKSEENEPHFMDLTPSMLGVGEAAGPNALQNLSITQLDMPPWETSPISSESRSDMVKVGSSGHTSGDEIETTTSSDIEVISSPNGDSSSTQSRHSPAKITNAKKEGVIESLLGKVTMKKMMGHHRELSEASSISDDSEIDRLLKRLAEVTEILELRENKLIETSRKLSEMQETNTDLQKQLDVVLDKQIQSDRSQVTEKYAQRLSALEKKFQQSIRDKDLLKKQLDQCKEENSVRMTKSEMEGVLEEKDQVIKELREEGEKLSKQQLQHSNIIKKLRIKEKEHEQTIKHLKESVEDLSSETERLKRSLAAKDEVERSQIEAIHQLTTKNKKLDYELSTIQGNYDDLFEKYETMKKSFDAAKKELIDKNKTSSDLQQREQMLESLENSKRMTESQNEEILNHLEDLRLKVRETDQDALAKEQKSRLENAELLRRLENAESRNEELSQSLLDASKPLVRQLEALQATHNMKVLSFEKIEQDLSLKITELQNKLQNITDTSKNIKDECLMYKNKMSTLQQDVEFLTRENEHLKVQLDQARTERMISEQDLNKEIETVKEKIANEYGTIVSLQKEIDSLQYNMNVERNNHEKEKQQMQEALKPDLMTRSSPSTLTSLTHLPGISGNAGNQSPTLSVGRASVSESMSSSWWPDENMDLSSLPRCTNMLEMQVLQTNLKQRDGDVQQLHWELNRREHERTLLNTEISNLLTKVEDLQNVSKQFDKIQTELGELRQQYDTMCQLFGEKVEENEELKLDLVDVKDMYRAQIDELLRQQRSAT